MRAVWLKEFGGPEVLQPGTAPDPAPGPGEALIAVTFANITFVETQFRAGGTNPLQLRPPVIPGNGVGGVVISVGKGVDHDLVGRQVVTGTGGSGGYAERVVVPAAAPFAVPEGLSLDAAVALLADGRTAKAMLATVGVGAGDRVLVEAAAGGVGSLLVQLAHQAGAVVIAAAGGARKLELAAELGADRVVDYSAPGWAQEAGRVDVVFDGVGGEVGAAAFSLLDRGGRMMVYGLASGAWTPVSDRAAAARGVTVRRGTSGDLRAFTESALEDGAAGHLRPVIGQRFPLDRAADAHRATESRATIGKTLLVL
ncbi:zinc-binding dehydrogenase [Amycolatopsis acidiphila]|uniref:Zinc-binding dehydrogenase n=1 Tax=Amycolatopsis acidiphila TaxID=715473 RepID=A0A558AE94_9PSEU|nr:zinc-binding dehydrogenase [Amycolatopsis acidiphila]TVT22584.1 zinc-binding dehydrogenase [Amycolatopsis acidiphila]UIJ64049.1 zinc-binding dehydrogenase [Amycolatopsis acidiphila]